MKKMIKFILLAGIILLALIYATKDENAVVIGKIKISAREIKDALEKSNYAGESKEVQKEFLESFIDRKLILKEAEKEGLDRVPEFLESVQAFWEQSLLKLVLDRKIKELSLGISVDDAEIKSFYESSKDKFSIQEESEVYDQIKLLIFKEKQKKALEGWIDSLKKKTNIKINYKLLNLE